MLDYGTLLSPHPIELNIATVRKPKLDDISKITFPKFDTFQAFLKIKPEEIYQKLFHEEWDTLSEEEQTKMSIYDVIVQKEEIAMLYQDLLNFFLVEDVFYIEEMFIVLKEGEVFSQNLSVDSVKGMIGRENFQTMLNLFQELCGIYSEETKKEEIKYKNNLAKKLHERMLKAQAQQDRKTSINLTLPNIISSVSAKHPSLNYINIWDLTVPQLLDNFKKMQTNVVYDIESRRVSVWGDEKNTFDIALWYKNQYDKI